MIKRSALLLALLTGSLFGNGGGYTTGVKFTGSVAPFEPEGAERVQILKENLDVLLAAKSATVRVRYEMKNEGNAAAKVRFGFPVEAYHDITGLGEPGPRRNPLTEQEVTRYCRHYSVTVGGRQVTAKFQREPVNEGKVPTFPGIEVFKGIGGWMVSEVKFPPAQTTVMEIQFESDYDRFSYGVDGTDTTGGDVFRYRLSTGAVWNGPIAEGAVRIRTGDGVRPSVVKFKAPENRFKPHADGGWVWSFHELEPTLADDITILTSEPRDYFRDLTEGREGVSVAYEKVGSRWFWYHRDFTVAASSTLAGEKENEYSAEGVRNPYDLSSFLAWVEGKEDDGVGEWITLSPREAAPLEAIVIRPGFGKTPELFTANNRPKSLRITLNGTHTFVADLEDKDELQRIPVNDFKKAVKSVKIEIASVYRGSQYRDTAVSEVQLVRPLRKEPKFQGAR
jgi:hypothetical protein